MERSDLSLFGKRLFLVGFVVFLFLFLLFVFFGVSFEFGVVYFRNVFNSVCVPLFRF